jgi:hypothetical protein
MEDPISLLLIDKDEEQGVRAIAMDMHSPLNKLVMSGEVLHNLVWVSHDLIPPTTVTRVMASHSSTMSMASVWGMTHVSNLGH